MNKKILNQEVFINEELIYIDNLIRFIFFQPGFWVLTLGVIGAGLVYQWVFEWKTVELFFLLVAFFFRSFVEWGIHYYIHHAMPLPFIKIRLKSAIYRMHIEHHCKHGEIEGLFMQGKSMLGLLLISFLLFVFFSMRLAVLSVFFTAFFLLFNEVFHALSHADVNFKSQWLRRVVENHRKHHQLNSSRHYGVSSLLADRFFNTLSK